jgi:phage gp29-like protein
MNTKILHAEHITEERVQAAIRSRFNPIPSLKPALLGAYLEAFRLGFLRNAAITWDAIERRDYRIAAVAAKRKKSVARHGWEILTVEDTPAAQAQKRVLEFFYNHLTATNVLEENETGGLSLLIRQMMDAVGKRHAVHEIVWEPRPGAGLMHGGGKTTHTSRDPSGISPALTATFRFCPLWWFEATQGRLRFLQAEFDIYGVDMAPGEWLVTTGDGIMEPCSIAYIFKMFPLRDWLSACEKFGMPALVGHTDSAVDSAEWNSFQDAIKNFSQDWSAVISGSNKLELLETRISADGPYAPLVEKMDRAITTLWRGGDLGTTSSHNATGASLQADEAEILETDDASLISETLSTQVSRHVLRYHFGDAPQLAYINIKTREKRDLELSLKVDQFLLQSGAPISVQDALERYDRPAPAPGESLLRWIPAATTTTRQ